MLVEVDNEGMAVGTVDLGGGCSSSPLHIAFPAVDRATLTKPSIQAMAICLAAMSTCSPEAGNP